MYKRQLLILATMILLCVRDATAADAAASHSELTPRDSEHANTGDSQLPAVHLDGNYFSRDGHRFIPVGANWVPAKAAMQWPTQWDPKAIEADFARMHELPKATAAIPSSKPKGNWTANSISTGRPSASSPVLMS